MRSRTKIPLLVAATMAAAMMASIAASAPNVAFHSVGINGGKGAEVLVGEHPVILLRTSAAGFSPLERAEIVADRLRASLEKLGDKASASTAETKSGEGVYVGPDLIIVVNDDEAKAHGATAKALATAWKDNLNQALDMVAQPDAAGEGGAAGSSESQPVQPAQPAKPKTVDWTSSAQKWVPIFSIENAGVSIGAAQIAGPKQQVEKVKGVAELGLSFKGFARVYAYIPVSSISTKLDRVQGVSVWAIGGVELISF